MYENFIGSIVIQIESEHAGPNEPDQEVMCDIVRYACGGLDATRVFSFSLRNKSVSSIPGCYVSWDCRKDLRLEGNEIMKPLTTNEKQKMLRTAQRLQNGLALLLLILFLICLLLFFLVSHGGENTVLDRLVALLFCMCILLLISIVILYFILLSLKRI